MSVFENRLLRKICWSKREGIIGEYNSLHCKELHKLYSISHTAEIGYKDLGFVRHPVYNVIHGVQFKSGLLTKQ
jgi:hypothetical protein